MARNVFPASKRHYLSVSCSTPADRDLYKRLKGVQQWLASACGALFWTSFASIWEATSDADFRVADS